MTALTNDREIGPTPAGAVIPLTGGDRRFGFLVRRLRHAAGLTLDQVATRCHITRKGMCNRELHASAMTAGALIETLDALGYDVIAVQRLTREAS